MLEPPDRAALLRLAGLATTGEACTSSCKATTRHGVHRLNGRVKVTLDTPEGHEIVLAVLGAGDLLGEFEAVDDQPGPWMARQRRPRTSRVPGDRRRRVRTVPRLDIRVSPWSCCASFFVGGGPRTGRIQWGRWTPCTAARFFLELAGRQPGGLHPDRPRHHLTQHGSPASSPRPGTSRAGMRHCASRADQHGKTTIIDRGLRRPSRFADDRAVRTSAKAAEERAGPRRRSRRGPHGAPTRVVVVLASSS